MKKEKRSRNYLMQSKFIRSISLQVLSVLLVVSIAIVSIVFYSFANEINKNIVDDKQKQLAIIEDTISKRMEEITSIAYRISEDETFFFEPVAGSNYSSYKMTEALNTYLVGNSFIEHIAYYRLSENDVIYTASGTYKFSDFWQINCGLDATQSLAIIDDIQNSTQVSVKTISLGNNKGDYFTYLCPIPLFSTKPQAFVLMMIPFEEVIPLLNAQLTDAKGTLAVYDANGQEIFRLSTADDHVPTDTNLDVAEEYVKVDGKKYVIQRITSTNNGWTYVSAIKMDDMISGLANRQIVFIILLLVLMFLAMIVLLIAISKQFKPISNLVAAVTDGTTDGNTTIIDENKLLSHTFATLKDDSEKKQHFESAYHAAEAANKEKSAFFSSMSHDIRTPMNAIIGMTNIAYEHADDPAKVRESLSKVQIASRYLLDIINNVLDMSRIESGRFAISQDVISLDTLCAELKTILAQSVEAKKQTLSIHKEDVQHTHVIGDAMRISQICINILSNSVKFTPENGKIDLLITENETAEPNISSYEFRFSDTGIGMSPEFVEHVFDAFSRANDEHVATTEGTGLGMAIVKKLVVLMSGSIVCESTRGKGTTFIVTIPFSTVTQNHQVDTTHTNNHISPVEISTNERNVVPNLLGKHILLAEDNEINREIAMHIISDTHADTIEAHDGVEALEAYLNHEDGYFDLILMDLQMPKMDGFATVAAIRASERKDSQTIPIYALTASTFDEDVAKVLAAGMNGHVGKPYHAAALYDILRSFSNTIE